MSRFADDYTGFDATSLAELVATRQITADELLDAAISRCEAANPLINALSIPMFDEARRHENCHSPKGPMGGVPFLLKDIGTHLAEWPMTSGSIVFRDYKSSYTSTIVQRYLDAGLVIFGRTTTPEFGYAAGTESKLFGATRNPWDLARSSGGSSGGAAAAIAAGIVPAAQGGDAGGSIRIPAAFCGLFGLKPTRARTPGGPIHGSFLGFASHHVLSRSVRDSARLLDLVEGPDLAAPYFAPPPTESYASAIMRPPPRLQIALQLRAYDDTPVDPQCRAAAREAARLLEELGHRVTEVNFSFDYAKLARVYFTLWPAMLLNMLDQYAAATGRGWRGADLEPFVLDHVEEARTFSASTFVAALESMHAVAQDFTRQADAYDIVLSPTTAHRAPPIGVLSPSNPDRAELDAETQAAVVFCQIYNATGQPAASLPLYWDEEGLPVGVQIAARYGRDDVLLQLAAELEQARPWFNRRPQLP